MKNPHHQDYQEQHTDLCLEALFTAWRILEPYRDSLVLIGGLVPRFLCDTPAEEPLPATMDVDLGIAVGVKGTAFHRIRDRLDTAGFTTKPRSLPRGMLPMAKFYKQFAGFELCVEFLADRTAEDSSSIRIVDNMHVPTLPGIGRALECNRIFTASTATGTALAVRICEIGPFLCLKLRAYGAGSAERGGKDVFDLVHAVQFYDHGPEAAMTAFAAERDRNPIFPEAAGVLDSKFKNSNTGPEDYAEFLLGALRGMSPEDFQLLYKQRCQTAAMVARGLINAINA